MRIRLLVSYDGTDYVGWQRQKTDDQPSVQATLEIALSRLFNERITVCASGRTDAGVHAEGQVVHFDAPKPPPERFLKAINSLVPESIAIRQAFSAPDDFHAMLSAESKTYRYLIHNHPVRDPLKARYTTWMKKPLDIDLLNRLSEKLVGEQDFKSFQTTGTNVKTTIRTITEAHWSRHPNDLIEFRITGTGFLKQMVRNIVGTLIYLHQNDGTPEDIEKILQQKTRTAAKTTAPPEGLHLHRVSYPHDLDIRCSEL